MHERVRIRPLGAVRLVAGADVAYGEDGAAHAAVVVVELPSQRVVERALASSRASLPYVPGTSRFASCRRCSKLFGSFVAAPTRSCSTATASCTRADSGRSAALFVILAVNSPSATKLGS